MCGRFTLHHTTRETLERFSVDQSIVDLEPRYNIAPSQAVAVVLQRQQRTLEAFIVGPDSLLGQGPQNRQPHDQRPQRDRGTKNRL